MLSSLALVGALLGSTCVNAVPLDIDARAGSFPPVTGPPGACGPLPVDGSCDSVFLACVARSDAAIDALTSDVCIASAICFPINVDTFLSDLNCRVRMASNIPMSVNLPRISDSLFSDISGGQQYVTHSSLSSWYSATAVASGYGTPVAAAFVDEMFDIISAWTGFCYEQTANRQIPKQNFEDWLVYSSTVSGPATTCGTSSGGCEGAPQFCEALMLSCASHPNILANPFGNDQCISGAACWPTGVDNFLDAVACTTSATKVESTQVPRLANANFDAATGGNNVISQQNFIDMIYNAESGIDASVITIGWPSSVSIVIDEFAEILRWTGFCASGEIPYGNFADWYEWSSTVTVSAPACGGQTCASDQDGSCQFMLQSCIAYPASNPGADIVHNPFAIEACVLAATCHAGGIDGFSNAIACATSTTPTNPSTWTRLDHGVWDNMALSGGQMSQQNYIDAYYGTLNQLHTPTWPSVNYVVNNFQTIVAWTLVPGDQPYGNFADWLNYS